jgi:Flp pilus assembly protein TadG
LSTKLHSLARREDGQALIFSVLLLTVLLGVASLVVDGGGALLQRRNQQGVADSAALAAVKDLPLSTLTADATARNYATTKNSADGSVVDQVVVTGNNTSSCDGGFGTVALAAQSVCVVVHSDTPGVFSKLFGFNLWKASARAVAQTSQVTGLSGWLPLGVREGAFNYNPPTQLTIIPGAKSTNVGGMINTPAGDTCKFYGGNQIGDVIKGAARGGADACTLTIGQHVDTQTGVSTGNITTKGFDVRIGSNTDSFSDVFGQDASGNWYVKKPDSPRLGIMPVGENTGGGWPLSGDPTITIKGYVLVYIGDTTKPPNYPAYSGNGNDLTIYLTPVNAPLPDSWQAQFGDYSSSNPSPLIYRLVS